MLVLLLGLTLHVLHSDVEWEASARWWRPEAYPVDPPRLVNTLSIPGLRIPVTASDQCWDRPLPCTCTQCNIPRWEARGSDLQQGFRLRGSGPSPDEHDTYFGRPIPPEYL